MVLEAWILNHKDSDDRPPVVRDFERFLTVTFSGNVRLGREDPASTKNPIEWRSPGEEVARLWTTFPRLLSCGVVP